jgi:hypothetical protein
MKAAQNNVWAGTANPKSQTYCYNLLGNKNLIYTALGGKAEKGYLGDVIVQTLFTNLFDYLEGQDETN